MSTATKLLGGTESQLLTFSLRSLQTLMEILSLSRRNQNTSSRDLLKCGIWKYIWCLKEKKKKKIHNRQLIRLAAHKSAVVDVLRSGP